MRGHLVEVATKKKVISFSGSAGNKLVGTVSGNSKWLAAEKLFSNSITLWDIESAKELRTLPSPDSQMSEVMISSNNKYVGVKTSTHYLIWNISTGKEVKKQKIADSKLKEVLNSI